MNALFLMQAGVEEKGQSILLKNIGHTGWSQTAIIFGAIALVALVPFLLVWCFRRRIFHRHKRHHHHHHHYRPAPQIAAATERLMPDENGGKVRKRWRRSKYPHRPLNPTLAQTRGLPPLRGQETPPPPPS
jgi:hypothetical protein